MNTSALKAFAPAVRRDLMEAVSRKLDVVLAVRTPDYRTTFAPQVAALGELARVDRAGLVERVAYTWFNRLTALRYLDAHGWHPFRARVLTAATAGDTQSELLKLAREGALPAELARHTDPARLDDLLDGRLPSPNAQGEVYRHLVLAACRFYNALLPDLFERLDDATELLLPDDLLTEHSVVKGFRTEITDDDCADVEVLGWLYQFYIADKKAAVMARSGAVPTADVPARTQLFTPHWIVRYLVENSLGRLWLLNRPNSRLREQMPYYVETEPETEYLRITKPEEIRLLDPAVGSGHMLTYAFDLLYAIYEEEGYAPSDIPGLILRHNLYGVDIDPRAAQIAQLALALKARERSRRFFQPEVLTQPHVIALQDVRFDEGEIREYVRALDLGPLFAEPVMRLLWQFEQGTTFGSLIQPELVEKDIQQLRRTIEAKDVSGQLFLSGTHAKVLDVLTQAEILTRRYHVVVMNPPYMGGKTMNGALRSFAQQHYKEARADAFAMFISRTSSLVRPSGYTGMVTMHGWMFLSSFAELRSDLVKRRSVVTMAHLGSRAFDAISGEVVQTTAFVIRESADPLRHGVYIRLTEAKNERDKEALLLRSVADPTSSVVFRTSSSSFARVPGALLAYWLSPEAFDAFASRRFCDIADIRSGIGTSNNSRFVRMWYEVSLGTIGFGCQSIPDSTASGKTWFPYNKGGGYRRWYGNRDYVVNWLQDGRAIKAAVTSNPSDPNTTHWSRRIFNTDLFFLPSLTWSDVGTSSFSVRLNEPGFIHDAVGVGAYGIEPEETRYAVLALLNTNVAATFVDALCPTMHFKAGQMASFPVIVPNDFCGESARECVSIAQRDWNNSETSWDFAGLPLLGPALKQRSIASSWDCWRAQSSQAMQRLQKLETDHNRIFAKAYGFGGRLAPEVSQDEITLARADRRRDAAAFLSYAVGCMMGRYSIDAPGLILADAGDTLANYVAEVGKPAEALTFAPDADGIIPVLDGEWFEDDVVARTRDFLRATFGEATLRENLRWLEESLGKDLRRYFVADFYKDHLQTYKKRPIYWLVQSPKKGFSVLVYLHRYTRDTLNVVLNRYLREYQGKLRSRIAHLAQQLAGDTLPARDRTAARKEQDRLTKVLHECEEWERQALLPLAQQRIALDLDDGVKVNYLKLADVLAPIPGLAAAEE